MITLTLLRHAKSGWDDPVARDFDRPLNAKGKRAAAMMGRHMHDSGMAFDRVVASPAVRVVETLAEVSAGYGAAIEPAYDRRLYLASASTLIDVLHEQGGEARRLLMVGHNPGLEDLVLALTPDTPSPLREAVEAKYPTATIAEITFDVADWRDVEPGEGTLSRFIRPRDLDPTLGPDQH